MRQGQRKPSPWRRMVPVIGLFQTKEIGRERGFFFQQEVDLKGNIYLTGAVRGDASSSNGDTGKYYLFPKASGSIRLSQYGFWEGLTSIAPEFKLRMAYGETGNLPRTNRKFTNLLPENTSGSSGLVPSTRNGDPEISPERTKEIEFGIDATLFDGNATIEVSYYRQNIEDLILETELPGSSGITIFETNAGKMRTTGWEASLGLTPIRRKSFNWTARINFFTTDSEITQLNVDPFNLGGFATSLGTMRIQEGFSPTTIVTSVNFDENNKYLGTNVGNQNPDFNVAFNNNFNIGNFELSFLWDWQSGGKAINLGKLIMDLGGTTEDWEANANTRLGNIGTAETDYIEDTSYLKLREASLSYSFPRSIVDDLFGGQLSYLRVGLAGRNLLMFADYDGYDPEVSQFGNIAVGRGVDTIPFPSARSFYFNVSFGL